MSNLIRTEIFHRNDDTLMQLYFAQNAGNGHFRDPNFKTFSGCMPPGYRVGLCRHFCKLGLVTSMPGCHAIEIENVKVVEGNL